MLSNKMTVSLMSLITIFALAFAVPSAMADPFEIKVAGPTKANYGATNTTPVPVMLKVTSGQPIADLVYTPPPSGETAAAAATRLAANDISVVAFQ